MRRAARSLVPASCNPAGADVAIGGMPQAELRAPHALAVERMRWGSVLDHSSTAQRAVAEAPDSSSRRAK